MSDGNYVRVWAIGGVAGANRWLEMLALGIFAYDLTGSPFLVALLPVLRLIPLVLFGAVIGTYADRVDRRTVLLVALVLIMALSVAMTALALAGALEYWHIAVACFLAGIFWTTDMPVRRRLVGDAAGADRLGPAMALDNATNNATRLVGPLMGGIIYQGLGAVGVFMLGIFAYAICLWLMFGVRLADREPPSDVPRATPLADLIAAVRHVLSDRHIRRILGVTIVFNMWGFPFTSMLPVIGKNTLQLEPTMVGMVSSLEGLGALAGALAIAFLARPDRYVRIYYFGTLGHLALVFVLGLTGEPVSASLVIVAIGVAGACFGAMQSTLTYLVAPPHMKSRIFGLLALCIGSGMIGFSNVGLMAEWFGASGALKIIAAEGLIALALVAIGWRELRL